MPEPAPPGIQPLFLRGVTAEKYGFKTGEGVMDLVDHLFLSKEEVVKEISTLGVMSDFEPAKKNIDACNCESGLLFVIDQKSMYGEVFLLCYTDASQADFMNKIKEENEALEAQKRAEVEAEEAKRAAEYARQNAVYEDKPIIPRTWESATGIETDSEVLIQSHLQSRERLSIEVSRPKRSVKANYKFTDRNGGTQPSCEFKSYKDPNFKVIRENDIAIQAAPICSQGIAQTNWYKAVNKSVQYVANTKMEVDDVEQKSLLAFLERVTVKVETALQQNESVDIFHEAFRLVGDDDALEGTNTDNELREIKNFADPNYSKMRALCAIDGMPKSNGIVAVSAVRNISFDQRLATVGKNQLSYILVWDFRELVKPIILMECQHEVLSFRFNKTTPNLVAGGTITGQVVMWDLTDAIAISQKKNNRGGGRNDNGNDVLSAPVVPILISSIDHSHKKPVADLFWLPANTQFDYRGNLVSQEYLDGNSYQFITIAGDGAILVWDIRYEKILADELRHIGRNKHVPVEKISGKDGSYLKALFAPIYRAQLKRTEGLGELSLCRLSCSGLLKQSIAAATSLHGDYRSHMMVTTEEGDIIFADICASKSEHHTDDTEEKDEPAGKDYIKWIIKDHPRPAVSLQQSPFFPDILLSIGDWSFNIWKIGENKPLYSSPLSNTYLTAGAWSPSRQAVLYVACADGHILAWDFTDSSFRPSIELKATHARIISMEFLSSNGKQQQLVVGDETGTLHVYEMPRNLVRGVHKEEQIMSTFLDRELMRLAYVKDNFVHDLTAEKTIALNNNDTDSRLTSAVDQSSEPLTLEMQMKAKHDAAKKEEDDFLKLELAFIAEVGLKKEDLPSFIIDQLPTEKTEVKK